MTCDEYRDWVAADVDGLSDPLCEEARRHAADCSECGALRTEVARVRTLLRSHTRVAAAPLGLRTRILARIDEEAARGSRFRRWLPVGVASAALAVAILALVLVGGEPADPALEAYQEALSGELPPVLRTSEPRDLEIHYARHLPRSPSHVLDLSQAGFRLRGGRVVDIGGRQIRLTTYGDGVNVIVCGIGDPGFFPAPLPAPGRAVFVARDGINFCIRRMGDHVCILGTRMPMDIFKARMAVFVTG